MIATTYGYVYVAQIAMGADQAQTLKAIREAERYHQEPRTIFELLRRLPYVPRVSEGGSDGYGGPPSVSGLQGTPGVP